MKPLQAIRGMNDILPTETLKWQFIERSIRDLMSQYLYSEIRTPALESTSLFKRSIGEVTDIVEKEMYTFDDRNGDSLTLRPEGTASVVRSVLQHGLAFNQTQRLWYMGPMYRHERPQKGRYRQFYQLGVEVFGQAGPDIDAEMIIMSAHLWQKLGIEEHVTLQLNSLGSVAARKAYNEKLVTYYKAHYEKLDSDSQNRLERNPLRILDSKNPEMIQLNQDAPKLIDYISKEDKAHFDRLCTLLDITGIKYEINPHLVRGLDYYTNTVFEWVTDKLGSQGTVCAGGRFDGLVEQLGGKPTPAIGFAMGIERLVLLMEEVGALSNIEMEADVYIVLSGEQAELKGMKLAHDIRQRIPTLRVLMNCGGGSFKSQFKKADKSHADIALVMAEDELEKGTVSVKYLREDKPQQSVNLEEASVFLERLYQ